MVLIEGEYTIEERIRVLAVGHPPSEKRDVARGLHGHVDFLGTGAVSLKEEVSLGGVCRTTDQFMLNRIAKIHPDGPSELARILRDSIGCLARSPKDHPCTPQAV